MPDPEDKALARLLLERWKCSYEVVEQLRDRWRVGLSRWLLVISSSSRASEVIELLRAGDPGVGAGNGVAIAVPPRPVAVTVGPCVAVGLAGATPAVLPAHLEVVDVGADAAALGAPPVRAAIGAGVRAHAVAVARQTGAE